MAKKKGTSVNDVMNQVEMTEAKPVVITNEVTNEAGETETITTKIVPIEVVDATGTTNTTKKLSKPIEVAPGVFVEVALGRPVDPASARQQKLAAQQSRKEANGGAARLGRPSVPGSANQVKKAEMDAKKADPTYVPKRGRPVMEGSARQTSLAERDAKLHERALAIAKERGLLPTEETIASEAMIQEAMEA